MISEKLKLLNNDLIKSASTGVFFRIGLFNNLLEASTMLRTKSESHGSSKLARLCAHLNTIESRFNRTVMLAGND